MNNELISRSELKKAFSKWWGCDDIPTTVVEDLIDNAPTFEQPTVEWVSKEEALKIMCEKCPVYNCVSGCNSYRSIEKMSSVQSQRPQGEWKRHDEWINGEYIGGFYHVNCPCEDGYYSKWETNFCPNCGADMGGKNELKEEKNEIK